DMAKTRVLIVDDSALVRRILSESLTGHPDIEVVGTAADPYIARDLIVELQPDVLTLDIEMPRMDGLTFLRKLMQYRPMPVIVISSLAQASCAAAMTALEEGAVEALAKPSGPNSVGDLRKTLADRVRSAARARVRVGRPGPARQAAVSLPLATFRHSAMIAIGASTGGTEAIRQVLEQLPANIPGTVITQHIPAGFSRAFSERLNQLCRMEVKEAADGDEVRAGRVLIAPGGLHMVVRRNGSGYRVSVKDGPRVCYQRPSVDVLFRSVAEEAGAEAVGALLTGMGNDGAAGLLQIRQGGGFTIAQDEESCVVFGMPKEAIRMEAAAQVLPLQRVAPAILRAVSVPISPARPPERVADELP
ncbi:MAG TPA: chemotaxis response regulator protein-glutamate methylesterase, partial [Bryobacteraceae bacterium]|nr:chemotaxis response regulator protein-glutamate methylesterase [Bryobacteraceae bacterium]